MNFLFLCDYLHPKYGYQEFHLANELSKNNTFDKVSILTSDRFFPFKNYSNHKNVLGERIHRKKFEKIQNVQIIYYRPFLEIKTRILPSLRFFKILMKGDFEICFSHSSTSFNSIILILFSRFLPYKLIVDSHMHYVAHQRRLSTKFFYMLLKIINKYFASKRVIYLGVTNESCDFLKKVENVRPGQIKLLPIGFSNKIFKVPKSPKTFYKIEKKIRDLFNIDLKDLLILQTGKLSLDKRPDLTITAANYPLKNIKGNILFVGPYSKDEMLFLKRIFFKNANDNWSLHFSKNVNYKDLRDFYIASDLLSYPGGASLSCIEGAASGTKSIVARTPEGIERSKLGISKVPSDCTDNSFIKEISKEIHLLDKKKIDKFKRYQNAIKISKLVEDFSYTKVCKRLIKIST